MATAQGLIDFSSPWWSPGAITSLPTTDSLYRLPLVNSLDLDFDHTLSLYQWNAATRIAIAKTPSVLFSPSVIVTAETRSRLREDTKTRTSEGAGFVEGKYPLNSNSLAATFSLFGTSYSLSNTASGSIYDIGTLQNLSDGYAVAGAIYQPTKELFFSAGAGAAVKSFLYGTSAGYIVQTRDSLYPVQTGDDAYLDANASVDERRFNSLDETMRNDGAKIHLVTGFGEQGSNDATAGISLKRRDFYFTVDSIAPQAKQQRSEYVVELRDVLNYPLVLNRLNFILSGEYYPKSIDRTASGINFSSVSPSFLTSSTFLLPSSTTAFDLNLSGRLEWILPSSEIHSPSASLEWRFTENSESNEITLSDLSFASQALKDRLSSIFTATSFDGQQSMLSVNALLPVFTKDVLQTAFSSRLYRYDTPSSENHDDRDELYLNFSLLYHHDFSPRLSSTAQVRLSQNHLVYLAGDRSAQNFTGKTISLLLTSTYTGPLTHNTLSAEVFSNYSVYDFDLPQFEQLGGRDYLIRGLNATDSAMIYLGRSPIGSNTLTAFETNLNLRLYERGAYNAQAFSERPLLSTTELSAEATLNFSGINTTAPALVKLGARAFYQIRSAPQALNATSLSIQERINRLGPLVTIILDRASVSGLRLYCTVWHSIIDHEIISPQQTTSTTLIEGQLGVRWTF
ncbi:MAG TPA: hypothetical protein VFO76_13060 [Candidatus Kapabacteria bacterium]|nr:hypothetical protein [Candidatus Kapabacteria bacterium]